MRWQFEQVFHQVDQPKFLEGVTSRLAGVLRLQVNCWHALSRFEAAAAAALIASAFIRREFTRKRVLVFCVHRGRGYLVHGRERSSLFQISL